MPGFFFWTFWKKLRSKKISGFREKTQMFSPETPVFRNFKINLLNKLRKNSAQTPKNSAFGIFLNFEIFAPKKAWLYASRPIRSVGKTFISLSFTAAASDGLCTTTIQRDARAVLLELHFIRSFVDGGAQTSSTCARKLCLRNYAQFLVQFPPLLCSMYFFSSSEQTNQSHRWARSATVGGV